MKYDYLIIGCGIAGITAAETIRTNDQNGTIAIVGEEPYIVYSRVLLPRYIKGKLERNKLFLRKKEDFEAKKIDLILGKKLVAINTKNKTVALSDGDEIAYGKIIIATGGKIKEIGIKGSDKKNVFYLQTLDDSDAIKNALPEIKIASVIGGGFIALEFLDIFASAKIQTTLICRRNTLFSGALEETGTKLLEKIFLEYGIETILNETVTEFIGKEKVDGILTSDGRKISCDAIGIGIGLERNISFVSDSNIKTKEGILTDVYLNAGENIFAAGDVAEYYDQSTGKSRLSGNWNSAFLQGKTAGLNASGKNSEFASITSYSAANLGFNLIFIGETKNFSDNISRIDDTKRKYERIFLLDGKVMGAALINMPEERQKITKLIEQRTAIRNFDDLDRL